MDLDKIIEKKFGSRFTLVYSSFDAHNFSPSYTIKDTIDDETFTIIIDSPVADYEVVLINELTLKISDKREKKIKSIFKNDGY